MEKRIAIPVPRLRNVQIVTRWYCRQTSSQTHPTAYVIHAQMEYGKRQAVSHPKKHAVIVPIPLIRDPSVQHLFVANEVLRMQMVPSVTVYRHSRELGHLDLVIRMIVSLERLFPTLHQ
jgi:hypothetical protein